MTLRPEFADLLTDLILTEPADHRWSENKLKHQRREHAQDRAQRDVLEHIEAAVAVSEPLSEIKQHVASIISGIPGSCFGGGTDERLHDLFHLRAARPLHQQGDALAVQRQAFLQRRNQLRLSGKVLRAAAEGGGGMPALLAGAVV